MKVSYGAISTAAWQRKRSVTTKLEIAMISRNRSLESRVQFHHFRGPKTRNQSFADNDQFLAVSVGSAASGVIEILAVNDSGRLIPAVAHYVLPATERSVETWDRRAAL
jgi:hypothetical protein